MGVTIADHEAWPTQTRFIDRTVQQVGGLSEIPTI
jgi:hypothetical protein